MHFVRIVFFVPFILLFSTRLNSQQTTTATVQRDPQAIAILTQTLNAAGGAQAISS